MTSNKDIPFAKSLIDYIFCWLGCRFIPGYAERNTPNRPEAPRTTEGKDATTAKQLVEKTKDLAKKIAEAKLEAKSSTVHKTPHGGHLTVEPKIKSRPKDKDTPVLNSAGHLTVEAAEKPSTTAKGRFTGLANRIGALVGSAVSDYTGPSQPEAAVLQQFNYQFEHFSDDAPCCDICGAITVRNGTCYKCYNCGNSMGCS